MIIVGLINASPTSVDFMIFVHFGEKPGIILGYMFLNLLQFALVACTPRAQQSSWDPSYEVILRGPFTFFLCYISYSFGSPSFWWNISTKTLLEREVLGKYLEMLHAWKHFYVTLGG